MEKDWWIFSSKDNLWIDIPEALVAIDGRVYSPFIYILLYNYLLFIYTYSQS